MAAPLPGNPPGGPGRGGYGYGGLPGQGGGGRALGGGVYSVTAHLRALPSKSPWPMTPRSDLTPSPGPQFWNPYGSVEGFEHYQHPLLRWGRGGDTFPGGRPDLTGFPDVSRVQEISNAQRAMRGQGLFSPRGMGQGLEAQNPDILALLRERLGMGGGY